MKQAPSARGSYSGLPFSSTRPGSPPDLSSKSGEFAFSTTLRRQSQGEHDHQLNQYHQSYLSQQRQPFSGLIPHSPPRAGTNAHHPYSLNSRSTSLSNLHSHAHHPFAHTAGVTTPSARFARCSITETASQLHTNLETGLTSSTIPAIREIAGANEFQVASQEKALSKFAKQFYESPLILLLLGSAAVSAIVGNYDDSVSITIAIIIVVTGQ